MSEWIELGKAAATGLMASLPVIAALWHFHKERIQTATDRAKRADERFDGIDETQAALKTQIGKLDGDFDGLVRQLAAVAHDVEVRFLTRDEHVGTVTRIEANLLELNRNLGKLNSHLFNLARDRRAGVADL